MNNYKKSLLSLATIIAISTTAVNANYIPLTDTADNEEVWSMFGVSGLLSTGAGSGTSAGTFSITDNTANAVTDDTLDDKFVEGLYVGADSMGKVKVLSPYTSIEVRVDTTGLTYDATDPVRTIYITMQEGSGPAFAFSYKASLEGKTLQFSTQTDGSNAHSIVIDSVNTYSNPALGTVIQEIEGLPSATLAQFADAVDYDFSDNPSAVSYYDKADHQSDAADTTEYLRVYSFDTANDRWDLYDTRNTEESNDFLS